MNPEERNESFQSEGVKQKLCTVTPFSKYLALVLFIALPFVGFWLGRQYPATTPVEVAPEETAISETNSVTENEDGTETEVVENTTSAPSNTTAPQATQTYTPPPAAPAPSGPTVLTVYITDMTLESLSVDNIGIYEGNAGVNKMIEDGLCSASEPQKCTLTGGVYYRNTDPTVRTYAISEDVSVLTWTGTKYPIGKLVNSARTKTPYSVTLSGSGVVTQIKEIYQP